MTRPEKQLLIIWHSRTGASRQMAQCAYDAAVDAQKDEREDGPEDGPEDAREYPGKDALGDERVDERVEEHVENPKNRADSNAVNVRLMEAEKVEAEDLLNASAYIFVCPENLASMSGQMKEMFDRNYYSALGKIEGRPYAAMIAAGSDGQGALMQLERIATGWRLRRIVDPLIVRFQAQTGDEIWRQKKLHGKDQKKCREIGSLIFQGLSLGVF